jgi:hypothetical protein
MELVINIKLPWRKRFTQHITTGAVVVEDNMILQK